MVNIDTGLKKIKIQMNNKKIVVNNKNILVDKNEDNNDITK